MRDLHLAPVTQRVLLMSYFWAFRMSLDILLCKCCILGFEFKFFSVTEQNSLGSISLEFSQQIVIRKCMGISGEILYVDFGVPLVRLPLNN